MSDKPIYVKGIYVKQISDKMIIQNINLTKFKQFIKENLQYVNKSEKSGDDYINLKQIKKSQPGEYGETHFVAINEYKPQNERIPDRQAADNMYTGPEVQSQKDDEPLF